MVEELYGARLRIIRSYILVVEVSSVLAAQRL